MRHWRRTTALLVATFLAGCGAKGGDGAANILNVGSQKGGTKSLMIASGALNGAPYKVSWSEFPAAQTLLEAIGSGAVDTGLAGDAPFQFAYQSGSPVRAIGAMTSPDRPAETLAIVVPKGSTARGIADLKGKTITTTRGSIGHYLALRALSQAGLPADAVRFVFLAPGDAKAAFDSGSVDAWAIWVPYLTVALREHGRVIVDSKDFPKTYGFDVASDKAIATKRTMLVDFIRREGVALAWAQSHKPEYAATLAKETGLPLDIATITADKNGRLSVPITKDVVLAQREVAEQFAKSGALKESRPVDEAYEKAFQGE